jgi:hypothetical protein
MASPFTANISDQATLQKIAQVVARCSKQEIHTTAEGRQVQTPIQSTCEEMVVSGDQIVVSLDGAQYTLVVRDSENSDGGDLVDLFLQYDSREDLEVSLAQNLLAFGDPALATLQAAGLR